MISNLNPSGEAFLANMNRVQRSVDQASRQASSGLRVNTASDAPDEVDSILQLRTNTSQNTQIQANLASLQSQLAAIPNVDYTQTDIFIAGSDWGSPP